MSLDLEFRIQGSIIPPWWEGGEDEEMWIRDKVHIRLMSHPTGKVVF